MKKEITVGIIVGILVPLILAALSTVFGWLPKTSDYRIPSGTIAAFALKEPPKGWEVYPLAQGRFIIGMGATDSTPRGPSYTLEQTGGRDSSSLFRDTFQQVTAKLAESGSPYIRPNPDLKMTGFGN